jgi:hypothetical protein
MHGFEITEWLEWQAAESLGLDDSAVGEAHDEVQLTAGRTSRLWTCRS